MPSDGAFAAPLCCAQLAPRAHRRRWRLLVQARNAPAQAAAGRAIRGRHGRPAIVTVHPLENTTGERRINGYRRLYGEQAQPQRHGRAHTAHLAPARSVRARARAPDRAVVPDVGRAGLAGTPPPALARPPSAPASWTPCQAGLLRASVRFTTLTALMHHGRADRLLLCIGRWPVAPLANRTFAASQSVICSTHISNTDQVGALVAAQMSAADATYSECEHFKDRFLMRSLRLAL